MSAHISSSSSDGNDFASRIKAGAAEAVYYKPPRSPIGSSNEEVDGEANKSRIAVVTKRVISTCSSGRTVVHRQNRKRDAGRDSSDSGGLLNREFNARVKNHVAQDASPPPIPRNFRSEELDAQARHSEMSPSRNPRASDTAENVSNSSH